MFLNFVFSVYKPLMLRAVNAINFVVMVPLKARAVNGCWKFSVNVVNIIEIIN